jgi:UDPglucose 6-dehydrogenase
MGLDHRIGPHFLQAGIGYGGSCFPKDVQALKQLAGNSGYHFQLLNAVIEVNQLQKRRVVAKLKQRLGSLHELRVGLLGLTFKPNTDDLREAASIVLAARLQGEGATVGAYDPMVPAGAHPQFPGVTICGSPEEALRGADAAILVTEWPEFQRLDWSACGELMARPLLVDGRNALDGEALEAAGFEYEGVGTADGPVGGDLESVSSGRPDGAASSAGGRR